MILGCGREVSEGDRVAVWFVNGNTVMPISGEMTRLGIVCEGSVYTPSRLFFSRDQALRYVLSRTVRNQFPYSAQWEPRYG